jgi:hydroxymethylbilane synthase
MAQGGRADSVKIRIATRKSQLALAQTRWVAARLRELAPSSELELVEMLTVGDRLSDVPLTDVGGKGLFVSELEQAVNEGRADLAVHSLKDVPAELAPGLVLGCVPVREDPRDVLVTEDGVELDDLGAGERIGTSSPRRTVQLRRQRNDLEYAMLRGNVDTRLAKLKAGHYRAIVLAYAGLRRLGLAERPLWPLPIALSVPAVGQGALALECRSGDRDLLALLARLEHAPSRACVEAERAFLQTLGGDCHTPLGGHARFEDGGSRLKFDGVVASMTDERMVRAGAERYLQAEGAALIEQARALGVEAARLLLEQGARELISEAALQAEARRDPRARPH